MTIEVCDLTEEDVIRFLEDHIEDMKSVSPPESKHALDVDSLKNPSITFWTIRDGEELVGCGALMELDAGQGEIKSMRTLPARRGEGIASRMLRHIISRARERGMEVLRLETGSMPFFEPAKALYRRFGFGECPPFADYKPDPNSVFFERFIDAD